MTLSFWAGWWRIRQKIHETPADYLSLGGAIATIDSKSREKRHYRKYKQPWRLSEIKIGIENISKKTLKNTAEVLIANVEASQLNSWELTAEEFDKLFPPDPYTVKLKSKSGSISCERIDSDEGSSTP